MTQVAVLRRVCDVGMTIDHVFGLVVVGALLAYLVAALVWPHRF